MNEVERERDFYRRTCDEMGVRLIRFHEDLIRARQDTRRSRMVAELIREVYHLAGLKISFDEIGQRFLYIILETLNADRAALLRYDTHHQCYLSIHLLGFENMDSTSLKICCASESFVYTNSTTEPDAVTECLCKSAGAKYLLWKSDPESGLALLICNETEDRHLHRPFAANDREIVEVPLNVYIEICERRKAEEQLRASLREKEVLLKELHHRTKNNMQVIRSMLALQAEASANEEVRRIFHDTENRIFAMSLVHQKLYQSQNLSSIDIREYVCDLARLVTRSYQKSPEGIRLNFSIDRLPLSIDLAIPCGLILNELLTNTMKYAFPEKKTGEICISMMKSDKNYILLNYSDNGIGVPEDFDFRNQKTLGMKSIFALVEHQLQGEVQCEVHDGLAYHIRFKDYSAPAQGGL